MPNIKEEQARKLVNDWFFTASNMRSKPETLNDYQRGIADTLMIVSNTLRDELKKNEELEYQKHLDEVLDNHGRYYRAQGFIGVFVAILIPVIIFLVGTGLFPQSEYFLPFAYLLFLTVMIARRWQARKSIDTSIIFIVIGSLLIIVSMLGIHPSVAVAQSMTTIGGQVMGAALAAGLVLQIRQRKDRLDILVTVAVFIMGLFTILFYDGSVLTVFRNLPGILGFELLGAGVTVLVISGWIED